MTCGGLHVTVHIDGGARGNPGPAGAGVVIRNDADEVVLYEGGQFLGKATNNVAEYSALIAGLRAAKKIHAERVAVASDSQLLVRQMNGQYRVKNDGLKPLHRQAQELQHGFAECIFRHVRREENEPADRLVNMAIDQEQAVQDAAR